MILAATSLFIVVRAAEMPAVQAAREAARHIRCMMMM
jgi:hypothetical protein